MFDCTNKRQFTAGDYIIYTTTVGRSGTLHFGKVVNVIEDGKPQPRLECITVNKTHDYKTGAEFALQHKGKIVRLTTGWNKLIIPFDALPEEVQALLG